MKLGIMQPYFFPYLGYWQLIHACDKFVLLDDVQFMRHGWIERNRILNPNGGWQYIAVPLAAHSHKEVIRNIRPRGGEAWQDKFLGQLSHYRRLTTHYAEVRQAIGDIVEPIKDASITAVNAAIIKGTCRLLDMERDIVTASAEGFDYSGVTEAGEWALRIAEQMGADEYINPQGGRALFDDRKFESAGVSLGFLAPEPIVYPRPAEFIPNLSIVDVLMFCGVQGTKGLLGRYRVESARRE